MTLIVGPDHLVGGDIDDHRLHRRGANIDSNVIRELGLAQRHRIRARLGLGSRKSGDELAEFYVELDRLAASAATVAVIVVS